MEDNFPCLTHCLAPWTELQLRPPLAKDKTVYGGACSVIAPALGVGVGVMLYPCRRAIAIDIRRARDHGTQITSDRMTPKASDAAV